MINRRLFVGGASIAAATPLLGTVGCAGRPQAARPVNNADNVGALPVSVTNNSGRYGDDEVLLYIVGTDLTTDQHCWVDSSGTPHPVSLDDNTDDGYTDYAIPLGALPDDMTLPYMSGRIYLALGGKLGIRIVEDGDGNPALQLPSGWVEEDGSFDVLHDTVEFTHNEDGMFCNTSMVDQFSVPIGIRLTGDDDQSTGFLLPGGRDAIFETLRADSDFSPLVFDDHRIIAPGHGLDTGIFPSDYFDPYVDEVWSRYAGTDLSVTTNAGTFTGRVEGDELLFDGGVSPIPRPSTRDVLFCDGALAAPNDGITGPVAAIVGAALNRSTLLDSADQPTNDPAAFYLNEIANHYAAVFHENTEDGKAYGFAFDDVEDFASYVQDHGPSGLEITLTPF
ncbi:beta-1,3-glucanase family protein [Nocardiopsis sp. MG754419]|uniref:beta-1,3-glucanase family protein n=1 Tax=Nocardiopsis sp. MG754419 TaxID=2259865 RepID=UPI001BAD2AE9|nr:beta-1,3-glucanase family protein [Nocardiopsis sp. MG754419]MBR8743562.1 glycosyl hydrolase [Nocardiopsis sp. MG754419]